MTKTVTAFIAHILIILIIFTTFGVLSLQKDEQSEKGKFTGELEHNVTIRILENDTAKEMGYLKELLDSFNTEYAEYGITAVDANMDQYTDLENDGPYGYGPDVLYQANDALMKYADGRHILPIPTDKIECGKYISNKAWNAYTAEVDGTEYVFGVPVNVQAPLLYYRKDMLPENWKKDWDDDQNGVPDMVEYWTKMYEYSKQIITESSGKKYGYMKSLFDPYFSVGYLFSYGAYVFGNEGKDTKDIGFSAGESYKGANIIRQLASIMNEGCIDDTITVNSYSMIGNRTYFATMTTPDVYTMFIKEMSLQYQREGLTETDALYKAKENLIVTQIPKLPKSGDLEDFDSEMTESIMMGGVNGYAVSSYTKAPNAALAFVNFATSYEKIKRRNELLGIVPARSDVANAVGGLSEMINQNLEKGNIEVMPSVRAISRVWTPVRTFFEDLANDPYRKSEERKYLTKQSLIDGLKRVDQQSYNAIHTLN